MSLIAGLLSPANVILDLEVGSKKRAFEMVGAALEKTGGTPAGVIFDSLFAREKLGSTGLGEGIAIPHGRIKGLKEAIGCLVRMKTPITFDAPDGNPVSLMFVLLVPEQATDLHLQILGELAQMFSDRNLRQRLLACHDAAQAHQLVTGWVPSFAT
jgi:PTS system nitrogen regulatory IIA component